ncbi:Hypothetical Protein FCC1311_087212 [Hondaea fermentalgiana]|uniref:Uncharacterized protein n=1 Tax=Hondaea fermentalgiana TaxID=2315210 RepID=A0A2R5GNM6_9STRA|nr:Hypothetical Protein FCC1311_087212 [Hondaea fermentalgiana]|eukprot:GBG32496.1 Hypothetical Protein FCC1311_087212 [Hondaea fermentalgiana]
MWFGGEDVSRVFNREAANAQYKLKKSYSNTYGSHNGVLVEISRDGWMRYVRQAGRSIVVYSGPISDWGDGEYAAGSCCGNKARFTFGGFQNDGDSKSLAGFCINDEYVERVQL